MGPRIMRLGAACLAAVALLASCSLKVDPVEQADPQAMADAFVPGTFRIARDTDPPATETSREKVASARSASRTVATARAPKPSVPAIKGVERAFLDLMNIERPKWGSKRVAIDASLSREARAHSKKMARDADIYHSKNLERDIAHYEWREAGENVGVGYAVRDIHEAFMRSETHKANIVHPRYRSVGIGVVWRGDAMYVTVLFLG